MNMRPYFEKMKEFGQELKPGQLKSTEANVGKIKEVEAQVEEAVEKKIKPIMKILAESKQSGPTVKDIFSGIGYIIGLVGIAAYFHSRKKKK